MPRHAMDLLDNRTYQVIRNFTLNNIKTHTIHIFGPISENLSQGN